MPTLNGARHIREAIDSVLAQTFSDFEFIIMDDGSSDDTESIIRSYHDARIVYVKNKETLGLTKSLNACLRMARGEYIARIDDDDIWFHPSKLRLQILHLDAHPRTVLIGTWFIAVDRHGEEQYKQYYPTSDKDIRGQMLFLNPFAHPSVVFRTGAALALDGYDERYRYVQDYDMWMKLGTKGDMANLPGYYLKWRASGADQDGRRAAKQKRATKQWTIVTMIWRHRKEYPYFLHALVKNTMKWLVFLIIPKPNAFGRILGGIKNQLFPKL